MKPFSFALALVFGFAAPASAQDVRETVDSINEAVTKAELQLAKDLGLIPPDDEAAPEAPVEETPPLPEEAPAEEAPAVDIMAAEQMFWADYFAPEEGEAAEDGGDSEGNGDSD